MGRIRKGILGGFQGKVGSVVGSTWNGIEVMRSQPAKRAKGSFSQKQLEQQARFSLMIGFLQPLTPLLAETFGKTAKGMSGINRALSYNIEQAVTGAYPAFAIDFPKVQISRGSLDGVGNATCNSPAAGKLGYSWTDITNNGDHLFIAAYHEATNRWIYLQNAALRNAGSAMLDVSGLSGQTLHTWIGCMAASGSKVSNSLYTGAITVQ